VHDRVRWTTRRQDLSTVQLILMMKLHNLADTSYGAIRKVVSVMGLMGPARRLAGPVVGRLLYRLSLGGAGPTQLHGHTMYLALSGRYPPLDMAMARYEPGTTRLFQEIVKPGMMVVDIGAHVGYYTLLAAKLVGPTGKVYAFEPEQDNHAILLKNIELNRYDNVAAARMAVSDRRGSSTIYLTALDSGRHSMYRHGLPERGSAPVETTTVDSFLESEGWPRVDLIKIDVEGAEVDVLDGMPQLLEKSGQLKLIVEFNPALLQSAGVAPLQFLGRLASPGWRVYLIDDAKGPLPLAEGDAPSLADRLLAAENSVNLFCTRE